MGGFYDPKPIVGLFLMQIGICINFLEGFMDWYKDGLPFLAELPVKIERLEENYHNQVDKLKKRADSEQQKIDDEVQKTRLSKEEIIKMFKFLDTLP